MELVREMYGGEPYEYYPLGQGSTARRLDHATVISVCEYYSIDGQVHSLLWTGG